MLFEALLLTSVLSIDALVSGFAYGTNKIKIPIGSGIIIAVVCSLTLGLSLFAGSFVGTYINQHVTLVICVILLIVLGLIKIFDSLIKGFIKKHTVKKQLRFKLFTFTLILNVIASPEEADADKSKVLSLHEAITLAIALSLDGMAVGLGAGMSAISIPFDCLSIALSFIFNLSFIFLGRFIGNKVAQKTALNLSWVGGAILIILAIIKLL